MDVLHPDGLLNVFVDIGATLKKWRTQDYQGKQTMRRDHSGLPRHLRQSL
jgi:hypothetical protein